MFLLKVTLAIYLFSAPIRPFQLPRKKSNEIIFLNYSPITSKSKHKKATRLECSQSRNYFFVIRINTGRDAI